MVDDVDFDRIERFSSITRGKIYQISFGWNPLLRLEKKTEMVCGRCWEDNKVTLGLLGILTWVRKCLGCAVMIAC